MPSPADPVDVETALQDVIAFLESPPEPNSPLDAVFSERLRQVIAASIPAAPDNENDTEDAPEPPALALGEDLRRKLEDAARRRGAAHPFGDHPDGIGPTLGMDLSRS